MLTSIVLAAGQGKRMKSSLPKVLHEVCGKTMVERVFDVAEQAGVTRHCAVVGHGREQVISALSEKENLSFAVQDVQNGTGHAVMVTKSALEQSQLQGELLILCGDTPCLKADTIREFVKRFSLGESNLLVLSTLVNVPTGYGRILRDESGKFSCIREEKDCSDTEREVKEINTGIYIGRAQDIFHLLGMISNDNAQGEYYLTDIMHLASESGIQADAVCLGGEEEFLGVNSPEQLKQAESILMAGRGNG
jgi:bifunctional UDP-N-acetylglucosamine pyrophosphorylase/glucosamine-1-phosphate N-acetyltransferase